MQREYALQRPHGRLISISESPGLRVMLLVTDLERGGTPLRLLRTATALRAIGVDAQLGCLAPPGPVTAMAEAAGVPTFACGARSARDIGALARLDRHVRQIRPDLIHATLLHANVAARLIGLWRRIPVLTSTATIERERRWHLWVERLTARLDRGHIVNSVTLADHVSRVFGVPARIVPPSIAPLPPLLPRATARATLRIAPEEFAILWTGRFDPVKRVDLLIASVDQLPEWPARLLLVGDGPDLQRLARLARSVTTRARIEFLAWQEDLSTVLAAADVFAFPSRTEGMPNAVLQAMAAGLPIIAADVPTLRELSNEGERMWLVRGSDPQSYADAFLRLHADPRLAQKLGSRAAAWAAEHLDPRETAVALRAIYTETVTSRRNRPTTP